MPRKGHTEEQIIMALRQAEAGKKVADVCREMGVSPQAFYSWKRKYAGLARNELRELRQLREENRKLKTLVADLTLDKHILQEVGLRPLLRQSGIWTLFSEWRRRCPKNLDKNGTVGRRSSGNGL